MGTLDPFLEQLRAAGRRGPEALKALASLQLTDVIEREAGRARAAVEAALQRSPASSPRELAQRLIEHKKSIASLMGGITGVFGLFSVPVDLAGMVYLQLSLLTEIATAFKVNLRSEGAKDELAELFRYANGIGAVQRASPRVVGSVAASLLARGGRSAFSRALPLVAAPISAYLNTQHIQAVGDAAIRHYDGWARAHDKATRTSAPD